jgi:hypothetical protein
VSELTAGPQIVLTAQLAGQLATQWQPPMVAQVGNADVFEALLPQMFGNSTRFSKKQQVLEKVDHYMLQETQELYRRLQRFCLTLEIAQNVEFKVKRMSDGLSDGLQVIGDFTGREALTQAINSDYWFVDSFKWLQPNYTSLAHSFEMLEFSYVYEQSPKRAARTYGHFSRADKGMDFVLSHAQGRVNAQVESPLNLYCVS